MENNEICVLYEDNINILNLELTSNIIKLEYDESNKELYKISNKYFYSNVIFEYKLLQNITINDKYQMYIFILNTRDYYYSDDFIQIIKNIKEISQDTEIIVTFNDDTITPNLDLYYNKSNTIIEITNKNNFISNLTDSILNKIWKHNTKIAKNDKKEITTEDSTPDNENFIHIFDQLLKFKETANNLSQEERKNKASQLILELANNFDL